MKYVYLLYTYEQDLVGVISDDLYKNMNDLDRDMQRLLTPTDEDFMIESFDAVKVPLYESADKFVDDYFKEREKEIYVGEDS